MSTHSYRLNVNGTEHDVAEAWIGESLLHVLRDRLGLPGAKNACEEGECGSCSVQIDGTLVCSCLVLAASATDRQILTIEGVGSGDPDAPDLSDVQQAFIDAGAVQCGFCTPGLIMAVHDLLDRDDGASTTDEAPLGDLEIQEALSGNLCRCTGYGRILEAVELVAGRRAGDRA